MTDILIYIWVAQGILLILYTVAVVYRLKGGIDILPVFPAGGAVSLLIALAGKECPQVLLLILVEPVLLILMVIVWALGKEHIQSDIDYIVVLGNGMNDFKISPVLEARLNTALELARENQNAEIVLSGGYSSKKDADKASEAEVMLKYLRERMDFERNIILEDKSRSTFENLAETKKKIGNTKSIAVVTNRFHMARAVKISHDAGFKNVSACPAKTDFVLSLCYYIRELGCWFVYWIRKHDKGVNGDV